MTVPKPSMGPVSDTRSGDRWVRAAVVGLFVLSGAAGLTYEVVWARQLVLVFGNTAQAVSAILTGFFAGMAIGSYAGGRLADRVAAPLRLYGLAEIALGLVAVTTPLLFGLVREFNGFVPQSSAEGPAHTLLHFALSIVALAPATVLMGASLPLLTRHLTRIRPDIGAQFGRVYAANTLGAVAGGALSGYVFIELLGLSVTVLLGACVSVGVGLSAVVLSRVRATTNPDADSAAHLVRRPLATPEPLGPHSRRTALIVAFTSGMTSLGYQVLWTRVLSAGTNHSSYVFTTILALFLTGIAVGALVYGRRLVRASRSSEILGVTQLLVALISGVGVLVMGDPSRSLASWLGVVLPATMVMGFALPAAADLMGNDEAAVGRDSGLLLAVNTVGTVVGTCAVPFVLVPLVGSLHAVLLLATVNGALAAALLAPGWACAHWTRRAATTVALVAVVALAVGPLLNGEIVAAPTARAIQASGDLFASTEDDIASVQAGRLDDGLHLWVGGVSMTALTVDAKLMPMLPLMARPRAESALVIAFGMGSSYRTALQAGLRADAVELVPSVPHMFGYYYPDAATILANPAGSITIADGRNYVEESHATYQIIVVDPPPPIASAGTGILYSREFYQACASRLSVGGVMMEWMPYDQSIDDFRAQMRTFNSVFPHRTYVFGPGNNGVFMLGSDAPIALSESGVQAVLQRPGIEEDLSATPDAPVAGVAAWAHLILSSVWLGDADSALFAGQGPIITDDRPFTEYFLFRSAFGSPSPLMNRQNLVAASR